MVLRRPCSFSPVCMVKWVYRFLLFLACFLSSKGTWVGCCSGLRRLSSRDSATSLFHFSFFGSPIRISEGAGEGETASFSSFVGTCERPHFSRMPFALYPFPRSLPLNTHRVR